ncbi:hypothetical protein EST38_g12784 [Candolleomyces aberdarensis]|uniref:Uncharacterized protein n=1 Tax=Candolleomyces aberdarensis TaxID=2316362 RepID=A0A4Q2D1K1_9AGAR|nr:hypothetical protein EST38_g12784 [Candolleomyces aberdarensis]
MANSPSSVSDSDSVIDAKYDEFLDTLTNLFSTSFTTESLCSIIREHRTEPMPSALGEATWAFCTKHPELIESVMTKVKGALDDEGINTLEIPDLAFEEHVSTFPQRFFLSLSDCVNGQAHYYSDNNIGNKIFPDKNEFEELGIHPICSAALVIAMGRKLGLGDVGPWYSMALEGLQFSVPATSMTEEDEGAQEICALAALTFFRTFGAEQFTSLMSSPADGQTYGTVLNLLKVLKEKEVIKYRPGVTLLERVISDVESHNKQEHSVGEVYRDLFLSENKEGS